MIAISCSFQAVPLAMSRDGSCSAAVCGYAALLQFIFPFAQFFINLEARVFGVGQGELFG